MMGASSGPDLVTSGLILYLDAGNPASYPGSGTSWRDISGNSINGTLTGSPVYSSNNLGNFSLSGTGQYADLGSNSLLQFTNTQAFTISLWFNWSVSVSSSQRTLFSYALSGGRGYYITVDDTGTVNTNGVLFDYYDGASFKGIQTSNNSIVKGAWYNIACTCDTSNTSAGMRIYLNGVAATTSARTGVGTPSSINYSTLVAQVGARQGGVAFGGLISQFTAYNRSLSASEVYQNYVSTRGRYGL